MCVTSRMTCNNENWLATDVLKIIDGMKREQSQIKYGGGDDDGEMDEDNNFVECNVLTCVSPIRYNESLDEC